MTKEPIFLVGAPRSGTTLLQYMLRSHPDISGPTGESHFIVPALKGQLQAEAVNSVEDVRLFLVGLEKRWSSFLKTDLHGVRFDAEILADRIYEHGVKNLRDVIDALFKMNAHGEGKSRWMDKTPYYVRHMELLSRAFPGAQFIHIVRDGRDVALSMLQRDEDFGVYNIYEGARHWEWYVTAGRLAGKVLGSRQYLEIAYEDLISSPDQVISRVCNFLNVPFSHQAVDFVKSKDPNSKTPLVKQGVVGTNREKWRALATKSQLMAFESVAGGLLADLGYPVLFPGKRLSSLEKLFYVAHQRYKTFFS